MLWSATFSMAAMFDRNPVARITIPRRHPLLSASGCRMGYRHINMIETTCQPKSSAGDRITGHPNTGATHRFEVNHDERGVGRYRGLTTLILFRGYREDRTAYSYMP
jgi:hypothetical protein